VPSHGPGPDREAAGVVPSRAQTPMLIFLWPRYNRNSMRVLPSVLGFTHSRSRNSATPWS
jgi:hypothetical protein